MNKRCVTISQKLPTSFIVIYGLAGRRKEHCSYTSTRSLIKIRLTITLLIRFYLNKRKNVAEYGLIVHNELKK